MLFNSYIFICILLPVALLGWYGLNYFGHTKLAGVFLTGISLWFYAYFKLSYLFVIVGSIALNFCISFFADRIISGDETRKKIMIAVSVICNLGIFIYFKYTDFIIQNINAIAGSDIALRNIILPLGISFFTFQQLSYVIDRCKGEAPHYDLITYMTFVTFFPQLIAGPIVTYDEMIPQFKYMPNRQIDRENMRIGIRYFVIGFAKKVLLADILAGPVNYAFFMPKDLDTVTVIIVMLMYMFELYFDFSGYCDMASGIAKMFNIDLPINFNSPYISSNVKELWQRWHITLSRFFTKYVYIPLGGSRRGYPRMLVNVFIVFVLSGLWHGAAWNYVLWGAVNGILVVWDNLCIVGVRGCEYKKECRLYIPKKAGQVLTFIFFLLSLCFFRSSTIPDALHILRSIFVFNWNGKLFEILSYLKAPEFYILKEAAGMISDKALNIVYLGCSLLMLIISFIIIVKPNSHEIAYKNDHPIRDAILMGAVFSWCFISLNQVSTFLYFNF
ncbi:MAG: MBOAT family protein [Lachnospiraceae bacterium]|nr:MBOAT family protein [Lachnospiraceae bacterium]